MSKIKKQLGFTLAEVLMVVGILAILFAIATPNIINAQKSLRQKELDTKAETIYTAVQNRLSELYSSGRSSLYDPLGTYKDDINSLNFMPSGYVGSYIDGSLNRVYYFNSDSEAAKAILGDNTIPNDYNGTFVIEYVPYKHVTATSNTKTITAATVYAVYYSEDDHDIRQDSASLRDTYRNYETRLSLGNVGYYGTAYIGGSNNTDFDLSITSVSISSSSVVNKAAVVADIPEDLLNSVLYDFIFKDAYGNTLTLNYKSESNRWSINNETTLPDALSNTIVHDSGSTSFEFILDSLTSSNTQFINTYGQYLYAGSDISLEVNVYTTNSSITSGNMTAYGNSIYEYTGTDTLSKSNEAHISNARHLQNLYSSYISDKVAINTAILDNDIYYEDSLFVNEYSNSYINNTISITKINSDSSTYLKTVPNFKSISNTSLNTLDGNSYNIYNLSTDNVYGGLFASIPSGSSLTIKNLSLVSPSVSGSSSAGGLVGTNNGTLTIKDCKLYLSKDNKDIPSSSNLESHIESIKWIESKEGVSGGLVGTNAGTLTIDHSLASTVIGNNTSGGLVGSNTGTLTITKSYASSYIYGTKIGGLIGDGQGTINIDNSYASGYLGLIGTNSTGAGLVNGSVNSMRNVYTIVDCFNTDDNGYLNTSSNYLLGKYYSTAISSNSTYCVYYIKSDIIGSPLANTNSYNNKYFDNSSFGGTNKTYTYNLMSQNSYSYTYEYINGLDHYGDFASMTSIDNSVSNGTLGIIGKKNNGSYINNRHDIVFSNSAYVLDKDMEDATFYPEIDNNSYYIYDYGDLISRSTECVIEHVIDNSNNYSTYGEENVNRFTASIDKDNPITIDGYKLYKINITYKYNDLTPRDNVEIKVAITVDGIGYHIVLNPVTIQTIPFVVTLDATSGGTINIDNSPQIYSFDGDVNGTDLNQYVATKEGYAFKGWYPAETWGDKVTNVKLSDLKKDTTYYAQYTKKHTLNLKIGNSITKTIEIDNTMNDISSALSNIDFGLNSDYSIEGWYISNQDIATNTKIFNSDGSLAATYCYNFITNSTFALPEDETTYTVYAKLTHKVYTNKFYKADTLDDGEEYLIANKNQGNWPFSSNDEYFVLSSDDWSDRNDKNKWLKAYSLNKNTEGIIEYLETSDNKLIWKYSNNDFINEYNSNSKYLQIEGDCRINPNGNSCPIKTSAKSPEYEWRYYNSHLIYYKGTTERYLVRPSSTGDKYFSAKQSLENIEMYYIYIFKRYTYTETTFNYEV